MTFDDYQVKAMSTAVYPREYSTIYPALGLAGEAGEVANKVKKIYRDSAGITDGREQEIAKEIGGVLWYCATLACDLDLNLGDIARQNLDELASRAERGTLQGSGDNR